MINEERIKFLSQKIMEYSVELNLLLGGDNSREIRVQGEWVKKLAEEIFGVKDITERNKKTKKLTRKESVVSARHASRFLMGRFTDLTQVQIGKITGATEHSVISNSILAAKKLIQSDEEFRNKIMQCIFRIQASR